MISRILIIDSKLSSFIIVTAISLLSLLTASCVSYDSVEEGEMNTVYKVNGGSVLMDKGIDKMVVLGARNDSDSDITVTVRAIGGEIGYRSSSSGVSNFSKSSSSMTRGAYLTGGNNAIIRPGEETMITVFLKNWYMANKKFKHRMEVIVDNGIERHAINIYATQDDIFDDSKKTFTYNKLGKNDPSRNGAVHMGVGVLPGDFVLTIPLK